MGIDLRLQRVIDLYRVLDAHQLERLCDVYADDVLFEDPAHRVEGLPRLKEYFAALYERVDTLDFLIDSAEMGNEHGWLSWTMTLRHPRLGAGRPIAVAGVTRLTFDGEGRVCHHRDYFDLGALLYEQLPLLGPVVRAVKGRFGA